MKYLGLIHDGKEYTRESQIDEILSKNKFYWLIDSEIEDAVIELKKGTIIWHRGNYYSGNWHYGIFKSGNFYGNWEDGIFEKKGNFGGKWMGGIKEE